MNQLVSQNVKSLLMWRDVLAQVGRCEPTAITQHQIRKEWLLMRPHLITNCVPTTQSTEYREDLDKTNAYLQKVGWA